MIKDLVPWPAKIMAKIVLARLPLSYAGWRRLNLFKHGAMTNVDYALDTFRVHHQTLRADANALGFVSLELGPGDSLLSAIIARLAGASRSYLIDTGVFASTDVELYRAAARDLGKVLTANRLLPEHWHSIEDMLADCRATYGTTGLESLADVPDASVDLSWSHAVLEHVRRDQFGELMRHLRRVARPSGVSSHQVDLRDHLGGRLNHLRFSRAMWEGDFLSRSGFYTNRLRYPELLQLFTDAGFVVAGVVPRRWNSLPTPRRALAPEFRQFADDDLLVQDFRVVLYPT